MKHAPSPKELEKVFKQLTDLYGEAKTELTYEDPFQLLVAVILSAQCTDERVNLTTPALFARFPTADRLAKASLPEVEKLIHSCGFYRAKAKAITQTARDLVEKFNGRVPHTLEELTTLRGVGRKTASVVMNQAFDLPAIAVDTHVSRVSQRLGWASHTDPVKIEMQLRDLIPMPLWAKVNGLLILHGRRICKARKPLCNECPVNHACMYFQSGLAEEPLSPKTKSPSKKLKFERQ